MFNFVVIEIHELWYWSKGWAGEFLRFTTFLRNEPKGSRSNYSQNELGTSVKKIGWNTGSWRICSCINNIHNHALMTK